MIINNHTNGVNVCISEVHNAIEEQWEEKTGKGLFKGYQCENFSPRFINYVMQMMRQNGMTSTL